MADKNILENIYRLYATSAQIVEALLQSIDHGVEYSVDAMASGISAWLHSGKAEIADVNAVICKMLNPDVKIEYVSKMDPDTGLPMVDKNGKEIKVCNAYTIDPETRKKRPEIAEAYKVDKYAAKTFAEIYKARLHRPAMLFDIAQHDSTIDGIGDTKNGIAQVFKTEVFSSKEFLNMENPCFIATSSEREIMEEIRAETILRTGGVLEIPYDYAKEHCFKHLQDNPVITKKGLSIAEYELLKRDVMALPKKMQFTLMPEYEEKNGKMVVNVSTLSKTGGIGPKEGYSILDLMKQLEMKRNVILSKEENGARIEAVITNTWEDRQAAISELAEYKSGTMSEVNKAIDHLKIDANDKQAIRNLFKEELSDKSSGEIVGEIKKITAPYNLDDIDTKPLYKAIEDSNKALFMVKGSVYKNNKGETIMNIDTSKYAEVGKIVFFHEMDRAERSLEDDKKARNDEHKEHRRAELNTFAQTMVKSPEDVVIYITKDEFKKAKRKPNFELSSLNYYSEKGHAEPVSLANEDKVFIDKVSNTVNDRIYDYANDFMVGNVEELVKGTPVISTYTHLDNVDYYMAEAKYEHFEEAEIEEMRQLFGDIALSSDSSGYEVAELNNILPDDKNREKEPDGKEKSKECEPEL